MASVELKFEAFKFRISKLREPGEFMELAFLVASNLFTIVLAMISNWNMGLVLWGYWFQSISIGVVNYIRMASVEPFTTDGLTMDGKPVEATPETRRKISLFFLLHYGFFHFIYAVFLTIFSFIKFKIASQDVKYILLTGLVFFVSHLASYFKTRQSEKSNLNIGVLMFLPYPRILPMHLFLIVGAVLRQGHLFVFLLLKLAADVTMHLVEKANLTET